MSSSVIFTIALETMTTIDINMLYAMDRGVKNVR